MISWLEKMRQWFDGEDKVESGFKEIIHAQTTGAGHSKSEIFLQKLYDAIVKVLNEEVTRIPNSKKAYIPSSFAVFLSDSEDRELRQDKREFFAEKLGVLIHQKAQEMAQNLELSAKKIKIEFHTDGNLADGAIEVRAYSGNLERTQALKGGDLDEIKKILSNQQFVNEQLSFVASKNDETTFKLEDEVDDKLKQPEVLGTVEDFATNFGIFYRLEIFQAGKKLNEYPIISRQITVGREGGSKTPNLKLQTDNQKISGQHAAISIEPDGNILVTGLHHKNPTIVGGKRLTNGEKAVLGDDKTIEIYDFVLKLNFGL